MSIKDYFIKPKQAEQRAVVYEDMPYNSGLNMVNFHSNGYMSLSAVFGAIEMIANTIAEIPIEVKQRDENHKSHTLKQHSVKFALSNSQISRFMLVKCAVTDMLRHGNGFIYLQRAKDGTVTELIYIPATDVTIYYNRKSRKLYYQIVNFGKVEPQDLLHIYMRSDDGINGISVLKYAARTVETANYVENTTLDFYAKSGFSVGLLKSKVPMNGKQAVDAAKLVTGEVNTTKNNNLIKFIPFDLEYQPINQNVDGLNDARIFSVAEVARFLNVPLALLNGTQISNIESVNIQFLLQCIQPILTLIEEEMNRKLISPTERDSIYIDFDETELLRTNKQSTATYLQLLVNSGIMTRNEARLQLGLNPVEGADKLSVSYSDIQQNTIKEDSENNTDK